MARNATRRQERGTNPLVVLLVLGLLAVVGWQAWGATSAPRNGDASFRDAVRPFVTTDAVNLRSGPGTTFDVLGVIPQERAIDVVGTDENGFMPVQVDGREAWIAADYLIAEGSVRAETYAAPVPNPAPTEAPAPESPAADAVAEAAPVEDEPLAETIAADVPVDDGAMADAPPVGTDVTEAFPAGERWVEVDRSTATVTLHEGDAIVAQFTGLIGKDPSQDGYYATATGTFYVYSMNRSLTETPFAPGVYLTDWVGFDPDRSNGFHSPVRDEQGNVVATGGTATLGCVRLGDDEARQMFDFAFIGMRVEIHD